MGIPVSLILIPSGAILTWGVTDEPSGLNLDAIGVILMVIGIVGLVLTLLLWRSWWGPGHWSHATLRRRRAGPAVVLRRPMGKATDHVRRGRSGTASGRSTATSVGPRLRAARPRGLRSGGVLRLRLPCLHG